MGFHFAVLVAKGTNPTEFHFIRLRLAEVGARVTVVGLEPSEAELEDHSTACAHLGIDEVADGSFDGVFIPGGLGPEKLRQNAAIVELVRDCHARGKLCAAICHGQQVLISAGLMRGVLATAAWSMMDDLSAVGAIVAQGERAVRDGQIVTAMFPCDLPTFFHLVCEALAELEGVVLPAGYPNRLAAQTWAIVVDAASDATQVRYLSLRVQEEGGTAWLVGRRAGMEVALGSPEWEWGDMGWSVRTDRTLRDPSVITSCDSEAELDSQAVLADQIDGLILPGGLGTWMIRGHPGLHDLIRTMDRLGKPIVATGRGPKVLLSSGLLDGRTITCAAQMRDDVIHAIADIAYQDAPVVRDGNLYTCQGTEDLPLLLRSLLGEYDSSPSGFLLAEDQALRKGEARGGAREGR